MHEHTTQGQVMHRRKLLTSLLAAGLVPLGACAPGGAGSGPAAGRPATRGAAMYIPGYRFGDAVPVAEPADSRRRRARQATNQTLISRLDADGGLRQTTLPLIGHDIAISPGDDPGGRLGLMARMGNSGNPAEAHHVLFDPVTLELRATGRPLAFGWRGGGHGLWLPDGRALLTAERVPEGPYLGTPQAHYGRIAIRDPRTLRLLDWIPCHGIDPHEIRLSADGRHVLAANYGSVANDGTDLLGAPRRVVEACVTVTDLHSGALVDRIVVADPQAELRHLALAKGGQVFGIRARLAAAGTDAAMQLALGEAEGDETVGDSWSYMPVTPVLVDRGVAAELAGQTPPGALRQGLSVEYDPEQDAFLATFTSSHRLMVFDAQTGRLRRSIDTRDAGLRYPCGLALLDGGRYAVSGYWQGIAVFDRRTHRVDQRLGSAAVLYGHSHIATA